MRKNNFNDLKHALRKRSRNGTSSKTKVRHKCPGCGQMHWAVTDMCYKCKRKLGRGNYELVFNTEIEREIFENTLVRIRTNEQILRAKGYDPNRINSAVADRILERI